MLAPVHVVETLFTVLVLGIIFLTNPNVQYTCFIVKFLAGKHYLVFMSTTSCIVIIKIILKHTFMNNVAYLWKLNLSDFTGETDWKVLVIDVNDPMASQMNGKIS